MPEKPARFVLTIGSFLVCSLPRSACSNSVPVDGVTSASRLLLGVIIFYTNVGGTQIADANMALLCCVCCAAYVAAVYVLFICTHMGRPVSRSKSIHLSLCIPPSVSFIYLFMLLGPCLKQLVGACICICCSHCGSPSLHCKLFEALLL